MTTSRPATRPRVIVAAGSPLARVTSPTAGRRSMSERTTPRKQSLTDGVRSALAGADGAGFISGSPRFMYYSFGSPTAAGSHPAAESRLGHGAHAALPLYD